jgi:DNA invertase Pin-like site-specific DNA recombinase
VDDGRGGDDFLTRAGLRQLLAESQRGDVIICRDQSRLGRDAIEVTLVVRDLVRDRGCRLYYYASGQEVQFANAIDQATTFIQGTGHQMELEAIRSRTREALRSRVRNGQIAGGSCYGYKLDRKTDGRAGKFTLAVVNETEAPIVRRIYDEYLAGPRAQADRAPPQRRGGCRSGSGPARQRLMGPERRQDHPAQPALSRRLPPRPDQEGSPGRRDRPRQGRPARGDRDRDPRVADRR